MTVELTPVQTVGPYFSLGLMGEGNNVLARPDTEGQRIRIEGHIFDGDGDPLFNVLLEIWQANAHGRYNHPLDQRPVPLDPAFIGFGRASTDAKGFYWFETIKPGRVLREDGGLQAPHIVVTVHASGVAYPLITRLYFADEPSNESDTLLQYISRDRRSTLLATPEQREGMTVYRFDIVLRGQAEELVLEGKIMADASKDAPSGAGKAETVFFALR
ncbi:MAG: protocatechuate 3,4-dioxygenase subunit alpha [Candidatus Promineofilum sp.]|nr:protocatechuate 3,4-dioxygenase subunit alpha [Promineifilum sp.]